MDFEKRLNEFKDCVSFYVSYSDHMTVEDRHTIREAIADYAATTYLSEERDDVDTIFIWMETVFMRMINKYACKQVVKHNFKSWLSVMIEKYFSNGRIV